MVDNHTFASGGRLPPNKEEGEKVIHSQSPPFSLPFRLRVKPIYTPASLLYCEVVGSEQAIERVEVEEKGKEGEGR